MKNMIFYFTGTGNSLNIARRIQGELSNCEIKSIPVILNRKCHVIDSDIIGFVFPVYSLGLPIIVDKFLRKIQIGDAKYIFAISTHGGRPGRSLSDLNKILKEKGITLNAGFTIKMPNNFILFFNPPSIEKAKDILANAEKKMQLILEYIQEKKDFKIERSNFFLSYILYPFFYPNFRKYVKNSDKNFFVNENCSYCGICKQICPVNNIQYDEEDRPIWNHNCELCLRCIHWCPQKAINFGKKSYKRNRYHHPDVLIQDLLGGAANY